MNNKQKNSKLLTFISPLLSAIIALYPSILTLLDSLDIPFFFIVFITFFISALVFISCIEVAIRVIYFKYFSFLETNIFVVFVFTLMSFIATAIVFIIISHESGIPSNFFNSWSFVALLIAYFSLLFASLFISYIYIITNSNKKFFLISILLSLITLILIDNDVNTLIFLLLIDFIIFFGATSIITIRKAFSNR